MNIPKRLSRRDFLKCAGIVAGSVALTACDGISNIGTPPATPHAISIEALSTRTPTNVPPTSTPRPEIFVNKNSNSLTEYAKANIAKGEYDDQTQALKNMINGWVEQGLIKGEEQIQITYVGDPNSEVMTLIETQDCYYSAPLKEGDPDFTQTCCAPFEIPKSKDGLQFALRGGQLVYLNAEGNVAKHIDSRTNEWVDESTEHRMCATYPESTGNYIITGDREYMRFVQRNDKTVIDPKNIRHLELLTYTNSSDGRSITFIMTVGDPDVEWAREEVRPTRRVSWGVYIAGNGNKVPTRIVKYCNPDGRCVYYWLSGHFRMGSPDAFNDDHPVVERIWDGKPMFDPQITTMLNEFVQSDDNGEPACMPAGIKDKVLWGH